MVGDVVPEVAVAAPKSKYIKYIKYIPLIIAACGVFVVIMSLVNTSSETVSEPSVTIREGDLGINDTFGDSYSGASGLDKVYDEIGGTDPLKNGSLSARLNVDTEIYSCDFDVTYQGENKKRVECKSGCSSDDDNSKFCEKYIYNSRINGGGSLDTIYDDAGGNESSKSGQYIANINISAGEDFDKDEDISCNFFVSYDGNNKRSVVVDGAGNDKCDEFSYTNRNNHGSLGDTLLDDTYISRRDDSYEEEEEEDEKEECTTDDDCGENAYCANGICKDCCSDPLSGPPSCRFEQCGASPEGGDGGEDITVFLYVGLLIYFFGWIAFLISKKNFALNPFILGQIPMAIILFTIIVIKREWSHTALIPISGGVTLSLLYMAPLALWRSPFPSGVLTLILLVFAIVSTVV
tara:strand:- start:258 stop:1478 length:1221 start_codon:yes stop_codon:yes gene_type:complete